MALDLLELANSLSLHERTLLPHLAISKTVDELVEHSGLQEVEVKRALLWLGNREVVTTKTESETFVILLANGQIAKQFGLPEFRILEKIESAPKTILMLEEDTLPRPEIMSCIGVLKQHQAIMVEKVESDMQLSITPAGKAILEHKLYQPQLFIQTHAFPLVLHSLTNDEQKIVDSLIKRKDMLKIDVKKTTFLSLTKTGKQLVEAKIDFSNMEEQLTDTMLKSGLWKGKQFRTYDVESKVPEIAGGRRHPLREANNLIRDVFIDMGFQEMEGPWVETAFWCMDSMWIPQDHPARDEQDTFFIGKKGKLPSPKLVKEVKEVHETGGKTGSIGHGGTWDPELASELILRTHSTATTFRQFGERGIKEDGKYFYVANVFRNEAVDTTHLAEFLQVEGFVIGDDLTLSDLMGLIKEFYARLGIHKIRFKPTYNPYTEPSLEAHYYDEHKKKWYALINSGIFRPESLAPYGIKKTVIAWGMGGSRVAALLNKVSNLRELVGPTVPFEWIAKHKTPQPKLE